MTIAAITAEKINAIKTARLRPNSCLVGQSLRWDKNVTSGFKINANITEIITGR
jgi:hypothetical protein